jgi:sugar/nucleoside kinase (ribokinase family)
MPASPAVLSAGIIVADHVCTPIDHLPSAGELVMANQLLLTIGGCAANAAVDLAKMGVAAAVVGRVGDDAFGRIVLDLLSGHGLDTSTIRPSAGVATSQTMIVNVTGEDRRFIHCFGANAVFRATDIPLDRVRQSRVLYLGGYLLMPHVTHEELIPVFRAARATGVTTVLDVAIPWPGEYLSRLEPLLPHVDVFLPNDHEGQLITGDADPIRQAETFRRLGARSVIITCGAKGAIYVDERVRLKAGVYSVHFVDGSGGGDAFDAGYICGLLDGLDVEGRLKVASALGASCVREVGTTPGVFTRAECDEFLKKQHLQIERI